MSLNDIVIASLSQAQESISFTNKSIEYLRKNYRLHLPDLSRSMYPNKFSGDEFGPEVKVDLRGKNVYLFAVPTNPANTKHYVKPDGMLGRVVIAAYTAKEHGAETVNVMAPDLFFSRADKGPEDIAGEASEEKRRSFSEKGKSAEAQAIAWKSAGVNKVFTHHVHSHRVVESYAKVFGKPDALVDLNPNPLLIDYLVNYSLVDLSNNGANFVLIRADLGADSHVTDLYKMLHELGYTNVSRIDCEKIRRVHNDPNQVEVVNPTFSENYKGLEGKTAGLFDDIDDTWGTKAAAANLITKDGIFSNGLGNHKPKYLISYATHPVLSGIEFESSMRRAASVAPLEIIYMNTHPFIEDNMIYELRRRTSIIRTAWFYAEVIRCFEEGIPIEQSYITNGKLDLAKVKKFATSPYRRTERVEYQEEMRRLMKER
ncbi:MAG: hypothetical protein V1837_06530 [Candidatus Woesearchaeota archaeon]